MTHRIWNNSIHMEDGDCGGGGDGGGAGDVFHDMLMKKEKVLSIIVYDRNIHGGRGWDRGR